MLIAEYVLFLVLGLVIEGVVDLSDENSEHFLVESCRKCSLVPVCIASLIL